MQPFVTLHQWQLLFQCNYCRLASNFKEWGLPGCWEMQFCGENINAKEGGNESLQAACWSEDSSCLQLEEEGD
jgi:hypothetical protein